MFNLDLTKDCLVINYFGLIIDFELVEIESKAEGWWFKKWVSRAVDSSVNMFNCSFLISKQLVGSFEGAEALVCMVKYLTI